MPIAAGRKLVIAISSRALFDLDDSHSVYEESGLESYSSYQIEHENDILKPGDAFFVFGFKDDVFSKIV